MRWLEMKIQPRGWRLLWELCGFGLRINASWRGVAGLSPFGSATENLPSGHAGLITKGEELAMAAPKAGARAWLAISGGIDVPTVLGSRSTDLRGNFGGHEGRALRDGDVLPLGTTEHVQGAAVCKPPLLGFLNGARPLRGPRRHTAIASCAFVRGANWDRFTPDAQASLERRAVYRVMSDSDRMGARLDGPGLPRADPSDLLSEAVTPGTLQVPPNGKPILLLGDCQTIGGYPKIAHVITVDLPIAAQLWPGDLVRFHEVSLAEAQELLREREDDFGRFRVGLRLHMA